MTHADQKGLLVVLYVTVRPYRLRFIGRFSCEPGLANFVVFSVTVTHMLLPLLLIVFTFE